MLAIVSTFVMTACSDDDDNVYIYHPTKNYVSMGVVNDNKQIVTDKGNVLIPDESSVERELTEGERVFLRCNILSKEGVDTFRVRVNKYMQLLTKDFVRSSEIDDNELGDNPINVERSWFGGGYLNLRVALKYNPSANTKHVVNLVYDEAASSTDTLRFTLCHNANGDTENTVTGQSHVSFGIKDLVDNKSKVYVVLKWRWYNPRGIIVEHEEGGYYVGSGNEDEEKSYEDGSLKLE